MIGKKGKVTTLNFLLGALFFMALLYTLIYFGIYGTGIEGFHAQGIQGFAIGQFSVDTDIDQLNSKIPSILKMVLIGIWFIFIFTSIAALIHKKKEIKNETIILKDIQEKTKTKTDLDMLYEILKERKNLHISTVASTFKIDKNIALEWGRILEAGNLVNINYPFFGEPEIEYLERKNGS